MSVIDEISSKSTDKLAKIAKIAKIARDKAIRADLDINKTVSSTFKMLSVLLQRGNAQLLLNRCIILNEPVPDVDIQNSM